jgi:ATP-dependent Lhr-like helicase
LVETYREVLQDAFDIDGLKQVLHALETQDIAVHITQTNSASPFAASLQFGFVMDWLYGDDTPRAEQRAALLSLDRSLLDDVMGNVERDDDTLKAIWEIVERRSSALAQTDPARESEYGEGDGARRGLLAKYLALAGPMTAREIHERYGWPIRWIERRLQEWQKSGRLVVGKFRPHIAETEYLSRKIAERGRRRALAALRRQIEAVELPQFAAFLQRWQRVDPRDHVSGVGGVASIFHQLYGIARPAAAWERDYLKSRTTLYDPAWLSEWLATGEAVWAGDGNFDATTTMVTLTRTRFFERGNGRVWLIDVADVPLSANARRTYETIVVEGASFLTDLQIATGLSALALRESLRELAAFGLVTNDTADALRQIIRWKPLLPEASYDPERWLPASFLNRTRPVRQRRGSVRNFPKWQRPDKPGVHPTVGWTGRWSLLHKAGTLGPPLSEEEQASMVAKQWLARYGIVSRDWWRRERPPVEWRAIYHELKRLEFRGEIRRGYFVRGLAGAQFALPDAVERLREIASETNDAADVPFTVIAASDPANPYSLPLDLADRDPLSRPRGAGGILVMRAGRVALSVEGRGKRVVRAEWLSDTEAAEAMRVLKAHVQGERGARYLL